MWVVFLDADGSCWTFENFDIRLQFNPSLGRKPDATKGVPQKSKG